MSKSKFLCPFDLSFSQFSPSFLLLLSSDTASPRPLPTPTTLTVSKLILVLILGLVKIIAIVLPARGLKSCASLDLKMALTSCAVLSTASSLSRDQSSMWRKCEPVAGGETLAIEGGASASTAATALVIDLVAARRGCCLFAESDDDEGATVRETPCRRACMAMGRKRGKTRRCETVKKVLCLLVTRNSFFLLSTSSFFEKKDNLDPNISGFSFRERKKIQPEAKTKARTKQKNTDSL